MDYEDEVAGWLSSFSLVHIHCAIFCLYGRILLLCSLVISLHERGGDNYCIQGRMAAFLGVPMLHWEDH
jgi:hypothetical protein